MDANTIIAICALVISVVATGSAIWSAFVQRRHMRLSVRPIASFPIADFEGRVDVFLANKGLGPMHIRKFVVEGPDGTTHSDLVSHMPPLQHGIMWRNFHQNVDGASVENGKRLELLLLEGDPRNDLFQACRDQVRQNLKGLTLRVEYEDLYGMVMEPVERQLSWFGRHEHK